MVIMKTIWISIPLSSDMTGRRGESAYSATRMKEIEDWLMEQWEAGVIEKWMSLDNHTFGFSREEDAVAFKLRWS